MILDLDDFKPVNDRYGHRAGDDVLIETVVRLRRLGLVVIRIGGDEFILLGASANSGAILGEFIQPFSVIDNGGRRRSIRVGATIGVSRINGSLTTALTIADKYLLRQKDELHGRTHETLRH
jgi:diguanylate cyclase (GGDEF)-like protein